ncbi:hypothetical protein JCM3766R1_000105 [Sporobolomyces carnicolor]
MLRSSTGPVTPTKRPLTELIPTCKHTTDDSITKKRRLSTSSPTAAEGTTSTAEKENRQLTDAHEQARASLPTPFTTPTKSTAKIDAPETPKNTIPHVFAHAHLLLSTSSPLTSALPLSGRSDQRDTLVAFLTRRFPSVYSPLGDASTSTARPSTLRGPGPAALYASGPPGIGKTALLSSVLSRFVDEVRERGQEDEIKVCMRNCSTVGMGDDAWERLGTGLGMDWSAKCVTEEGGQVKLKGNEAFEQGLKDGKKYLLILDEIDHLCSNSTSSSSSAPDLLNSLFSLASIPSSPLTLIGIANDLTLKALNLSSASLGPSPLKLFGKAKSKLDPLTTPTKPINLHFAPYSWQELVKIVAERLALLPADANYPISCDEAILAATESVSTLEASKTTFPLIDKVALERAAKKVATGTGDVRTILDLVRKSISLSTSTSTPSAPLVEYSASTAPKASMKHMTMALSTSTGLTSAPSLSSRLQSLNPNHRFVFVSTLIAWSRSTAFPLGLDTNDSTTIQGGITLEQGWEVYKEVVSREESLKSVMHQSKDGFSQALEMIQDLSGFVRIEQRRGGGPLTPTKPRSTPSPQKRTKTKTTMTISVPDSTPIHELVKLFSSPSTGVPGDETSRLCRKMIEREMSDQRWKRKLVEMGRDEDRRAEEELEGREWERSMKAQAVERGEL